MKRQEKQHRPKSERPVVVLPPTDLRGPMGNAWALMGFFERAAKKQGWLQSEIDELMEECRAGDYDHLIKTLTENTNKWIIKR